MGQLLVLEKKRDRSLIKCSVIHTQLYLFNRFSNNFRHFDH